MDARCLLRAIDAAAARKSLSKLRHFQSAPSSPLQGLCIYRKAINKNKPQSSGVLPSRQSIEWRTILAHLLRRCTRLLMVLPSRQQSAMYGSVTHEDMLIIGLR